jgi:hypothetical protein
VKKFLVAGVSIVALSAVALSVASSDASAAAKRRVVVVKHYVAPAPAPAPITAHGPDLIVLPDQTVLTVNPKGCDVNEELLSGTVGVKNQGDGRADRLIVEPIVSVWIPEMLDMKDDKLVPNSMAPLEIFSTDVHIGKGKVKSGRGLVGKRNVYIMVDPYNKIAETNELNNLLVRQLIFNCK